MKNKNLFLLTFSILLIGILLPLMSAQAPTVETLSALNIDEDEAMLTGQVTNVGGIDDFAISFQIREVGSPTWITGFLGWFETPTYGWLWFHSLTPDTQYEWRILVAYYIGPNGYQLTGDTKTFYTLDSPYVEPEEPPLLTNLNPNLISHQKAMLRGEILELRDYSEVTVKFYYKEKDVVGPMISYDASEVTIYTTGSYGMLIEGLNSDTEYEYTLAYNNTEDGEYYGAVPYKTFKTLTPPEIPLIQTVPIIERTSNSAILRKWIISLGIYDEVISSFGFSDDGISFYTPVGAHDVITSTGYYGFNITGLTTNHTYYFQAVVAYGEPLQYVMGDILTFNLADDVPTLETLNASPVGSSFALLRGNITDIGNDTLLTTSFELRKDDEPFYDYGQTSFPLPTVGEFSFLVSDLSPLSTYQYRAKIYSHDYSSWFYGNISNFTTLAPAWTYEDNQTVGLGEFNQLLSGLRYGSTYEFQAIMVVGNETFYGEVLTFDTLDYVPEVTIPIPDKTMYFETDYNLSLDLHFINYEDYILYIDGIPTLASITLYDFDTAQPTLSIGVEDTYIYFESWNAETEFDIEIIASNPEGSISDTFTLTIEPYPPTFVSRLINFILGFFPSSDDLSTAQKLGFVVISMVIISIILLLIAHTSTGGIPSTMIYVVLILNFALFIFFVGIGYIPVVVIILFTLILIVLTWFRLRGPGG